MSRTRNRNGFTLIEVLVVVAIIALLVAILLPSLKEARDQAYRVGCQSNFHSIAHSMSFYVEDTKQNWYMFNRTYNFTTGVWDGISMSGSKVIDSGAGTIGDDSVVAMALDMNSVGKPGSGATGTVGTPNKRYIRDWSVLICPGTKNKVRNAGDLNNNADSRSSGPSDGNFGHSYEWWNGFQKYDYAGPGSIKVGNKNLAYSSSEGDSNGDGFPDCLKRPKALKRPNSIILTLDGDDPTSLGAYEDRNNWPDSPEDNHGYKGWNMLFADMHAKFITREQTYHTLDRSDMDTSSVPPEFIPKGSTPSPGGGGG